MNLGYGYHIKPDITFVHLLYFIYLSQNFMLCVHNSIQFLLSDLEEKQKVNCQLNNPHSTGIHNRAAAFFYFSFTKG